MTSEASNMDALKRPTRQDPQGGLFEVEPDWRQEWWGMPEFDAGDASPQRSLTIHFMTDNDCKEFCKAAGLTISAETKSLYYPQQKHLTPGLFAWAGTPSPTRYPVYVPSKGRAHIETTGQLLAQAGVDFRFVVEETEADQYLGRYPGKVLVLPFHDLGQGSIPARNWIWENAQKSGAPWHWSI